MSDKNKWPCPGDPKKLLGQPIGMYHCEYCGEMQIASMEHLPPQFPSQWEEPFPRIVADGPVPLLYAAVQSLRSAAERRDSDAVGHYLQEILQCSTEEQCGVWDALHAHREDDNAKFILEHVNLDRDENDNWIVSLKGEF